MSSRVGNIVGGLELLLIKCAKTAVVAIILLNLDPFVVAVVDSFDSLAAYNLFE